jgi:Uma2 family endonuclease
MTAMSRIALANGLLHRLGGIRPSRVLLKPAPGTATLRDLFRAQREEPRVLELIDGTLVAKAVGFREAVVAGHVTSAVVSFARENSLGIVVGSKGLMKLSPKSARSPEVSFISWNQLPNRKLPRQSVPRLFPELAVEVWRKENTRKEMARKRKEYFAAGCRLMWIIHVSHRTVELYVSPDEFTTVSEFGMLDGDDVLPGFSLPVRSLFVDLAPPRSKPRKRR